MVIISNFSDILMGRSAMGIACYLLHLTETKYHVCRKIRATTKFIIHHLLKLISMHITFFILDLSSGSPRFIDCFPLPPKQPTLNLNVAIPRNLLLCISTTHHLQQHFRISQIKHQFARDRIVWELPILHCNQG